VAAVEKVYADCGNMLRGLHQIIVGERSAKDMGGPVKIVEYSGMFTQNISDAVVCTFGGEVKLPEGAKPISCGEMAINGFINALMFTAMISTMLGLMNLLPVPMLDGGHLAFYAVEAIIRRPVHEKVQDLAFRVGFAFLISLMLYVTYNDIVSIVQRFIMS
jgi:regulator of sigma E protease